MSAPASPPPAEPPQEGERDDVEAIREALDDLAGYIAAERESHSDANGIITDPVDYARIRHREVTHQLANDAMRAGATRETQPPLDRGFPLGRVDGVAHLIRTRLGLSYDDGRVESVAAKILDLYGQPIGGEGAGSPRGEP